MPAPTADRTPDRTPEHRPERSLLTEDRAATLVGLLLLVLALTGVIPPGIVP